VRPMAKSSFKRPRLSALKTPSDLVLNPRRLWTLKPVRVLVLNPRSLQSLKRPRFLVLKSDRFLG
jgi:hypothetical protein